MVKARASEAADQGPTGGVVDLLDWNRSLDCEGWTFERIDRLVARNPDLLVLRTPETTVEVRSHELYNQGVLITLPGIDKDRIAELRELGLVAIRAGKHYLYEGRRIIALMRGNLRALERFERLLRGDDS